MLLAAIDENHHGTYDFIYLPIDFKVRSWPTPPPSPQNEWLLTHRPPSPPEQVQRGVRVHQHGGSWEDHPFLPGRRHHHHPASSALLLSATDRSMEQED